MSNNGSKPERPSKPEWVRAALVRFERPLVRYAQRITGDVESARDAVQETFLRLCRAEPAELDAHLAEWLFTVCRNQAISVCRKETRMTTLSETKRSDLPSRESEPAETAERRDSAGAVLKLLAALPDNQQEVIRLRFQNGLSYREISSVTSLSVSNVGFLIHRAMKTLREQLLGYRQQGAEA